MQRRSVCSLLVSGASVAALAACGGGSALLESEELEPASAKQEAAAEPTAAPAQEQPKTESQAEAQPAATQAPTLDLPVLGKAPEITLTGWFNSDPITMASLEGKAAALVVFWTYT